MPPPAPAQPAPPGAKPPKRKITDSIAVRYVVAVLGAWCAEGATYPFDLTKTRLQIQSEVATAKHGYKLEKKGMIKTAIGIAQKEGVLKLWGGMIPMLQRHVLYAGSRLVTYEQFRNHFKDEKGKISLGMATVGGVVSGAFAQFISNPADLVKVQMQAEGRRILQGKPPRFSNCRKCYRMLYAESGFFGFWRGAVPNMQRAALVTIGDVTAYDYSKRLLMRKFDLKDGPLLHGASASMAGFVAAILATPADVLKTRLMNQPVGPDGRGLTYSGMLDCLRQSVRNEGLFALYKGFVPLWIRLGPWALVNWLAFENIMKAIGGKAF
ncbi:hypothetical protein PYW08_016445 [Mythimna loreyi]|uniref:Uncharacterized protein n=1 Tax=Mythimna loreyi TaxID=667449 RepID=A0ACC2QZ47_9NEOP|nr:hypothetical protein PYW08_016445 [Mythimna loreyi]